ncbi:MAG: hypothetical protein HY907_13350 [Deltaproteobacteria bacterium]|nr:hypothetical protein [Deltaproteobacteria bacterium]
MRELQPPARHAPPDRVCVRGRPWILAFCLLLSAGLGSCRRREGGGSAAPEVPEVPAAAIPPALIEQTLRDSRARQSDATRSSDLDLLERRFRRMNLVAMGRNPDGGRPIYTTKNESPEFRQLARLLRSQLGDDAVDVRGEALADRGLAVLLDDAGRFRVPLAPDTFLGDDPGEAAVDILGWTRDLPLILLHHDLVGPGNRSKLPPFTLRALLRARWNIETGQPADHAFSDAERIAWLEFLGRWKSWSPHLERRAALEDLARLLPSYPLRDALEALARTPQTGPFVIHEEGE